MRKSQLVFLVVVLSLFFLALLLFLIQKQGQVVKGDSYLVLWLSGYVPETPPQSFPPFSGVSLREIYRALERAKGDSKIRGVFLKITFPIFGWGKAEELRNLLLSFRKTGKKVVAFVEGADDLGYYIATSADKIYTFAGSFVEINGIAAQRLYYKRLFDKWGVSVQIFHIGKWKTASNSYTERGMTPWEREQLLRIGNGIMDELVSAIASSRKMTPEQVREFMDREGGGVGVEFKNSPFFDDVLPEAQVIEKEFQGLGRVRLKRYAASKGFSPAPAEVAVVFAEGAINLGKSGSSPLLGRVIGADTLRGILKKLEKDGRTKAVVLRVNSPGGSALASELIENSVSSLARRKPVVVSMSSYAASGGYYISAPATKILSEKLTLTGSIGIIGGKLSIGGTLKKLGIDEDHISLTRTALLNSTFTPYDEYQFEVVKKRLRAFYRLFLKRVAQGRKKSEDYIDSIGRGKVFLGEEALKNGLVDEIGGLPEAVKEASKLAKLRFYTVRFYPRKKSLFETILDTLGQWNTLKAFLSQGFYFLPPALYAFR